MNTDKLRKLTLKEIQKNELDILKFVDKFCHEHEIKYSLDSGTLLGAVRHKGFIPWDDDIDIIMLREDYDKFLSALKNNPDPSGRYKLYNYTTTPGYYENTFSKVVDTSTIAIEPNTKTDVQNGLGVYIDIFPIDYLPKNRFARKFTLFKFFLINRILVAKSRYDLSLFCKILKLCFFFAPAKLLLPLVDRYAKKHHERADYATNLAFVTRHYLQSLRPSSIYDGLIKLPFEDCEFPCLKQYDAYLTSLYGSDYMQLPPESKRYSHSLDAYEKESCDEGQNAESKTKDK